MAYAHLGWYMQRMLTRWRALQMCVQCTYSAHVHVAYVYVPVFGFDEAHIYVHVHVHVHAWFVRV